MNGVGWGVSKKESQAGRPSLGSFCSAIYTVMGEPGALTCPLETQLMLLRRNQGDL